MKFRVVGIVGSEQAKFTPHTEAEARLHCIDVIETYDPEEVVSGECHLGGVDIYAKETALALNRKFTGHAPKTRRWSTGFKPRNLLIARADHVVCITLKELPESYKGMRFDGCYHCGDRNPPHVKSGGCWTAWQAKSREWRIV